MGDRENGATRTYAYHPSVANWIHSTSLATQVDGPSDEPLEQSPDDFYTSSFHQEDVAPTPLASDDMTSTRQRQQAANGAVRSTPRAAPRSASGPASSTAGAPRPSPQIPVNHRPTVKSLAQKFNQPSSAETSPASARRPARPSASTRSATASPSVSSSPARPTKEASYGPHKFSNLKPRERPQPAPASPASVRRTSGRKGSVDEQTTPSRRKLSSSTHTRNQSSASGRQPFFGEVVGQHDASTPGFGIPIAEDTPHDSAIESSTSADASDKKELDHESQLTLEPSLSTHSHRKLPSGQTSTPQGDARSTPATFMTPAREPRRASPPSRIPVASKRLSGTSDSSSSSRSYKAGSARPSGGYSRTSPIRTHRRPIGKENSETSRTRIPATTLPATSYRGYRERGKPAQGSNTGTGLAAAVTPASQQPPSPRLRNSRERHLLPSTSPDLRSRSSDQHVEGQEDDPTKSAEGVLDMTEELHAADFAEELDLSADFATRDELAESSFQAPLNVTTSGLQAPQMSSTYEFDESPVLGMPGSFMMTPPTVQNTPPMELKAEASDGAPLQPSPKPQAETLLPRRFVQPHEIKTLQPSTFQHSFYSRPPDGQTELTMNEASIPIMLGADEPELGWSPAGDQPRHSPRLSIGAHKWRAEPLDASGTISYLDEDDSPTEPFSNRESLRPDDSASGIFYRHAERKPSEWTPKMASMPEAGRLTLDSEAYSVINKVLNLYHKSDRITADVAYNSMKQIQKVSPRVAQHRDWGSKESTETYLARLLSDANGSEETGEEGGHGLEQAATQQQRMPAVSIQDLDGDDDGDAHQGGGTAIIFQPETRRYSRGSKGSRGSTVTTIHDDTGRADGFSGPPRAYGYHQQHQQHYPASYAPQPPPKDSYSLSHHLSDPFLPEIETSADGLGLSLRPGKERAGAAAHHPQQHQQAQPQSHQHAYPRSHQQEHLRGAPPRPAYSPPPPPQHVQPAITAQAGAPYTPSIYSQQSQPHPRPHPHPTATTTISAATPDMGPAYSTEPKGAGAAADDDTTPLLEQPEETAGADSDVESETDRAAEEKRLRKRYRVMEELNATEHFYSSDLMVIKEIFLGTADTVFPEARDRHTLFCNVAELAKFAYDMWQNFKKAAEPVVNQEPKPDSETDPPYDEFLQLTKENDEKTEIGAAFRYALPKYEKLYTKYILNHDHAQKLMDKSKDKEGYIGWHMACVAGSQGLTNAWDLDSLLVKPVQRLTRYPLLLQALLEATPEDHPDHDDLAASHKAVLALIESINLAKRREETLLQASGQGKQAKKKGFRGIPIVKGLQRKTEKPKLQPVSGADAFVDKEYERLYQRFGGHFFQIQIVIRDLELYLDKTTDTTLHLSIIGLGFIQLLESGPSSAPELESAWRLKAMALLDCRNVLLEDHKKAVRLKVMAPIQELWTLNVKPQKMMEQRKRAMPQYTKYKQLVARGEKIDPKLEEAAKTVIASTDQLKAELPILYEKSKKAVARILEVFVWLQLEYFKNCQKKLLPLLETEPEHTTSFEHDMAAYMQRHQSDFHALRGMMERFRLVNGNALSLSEMSTVVSPRPSTYTNASARNSTGRRTESVSSGPTTQARHIPQLDGNSDDVPPPALLPAQPSPARPASARASGVFSSALPMADGAPWSRSVEELGGAPGTPAESSDNEPEVLFLAASLFEFNIAHDRKEGGIPYLVYVPGEVFDVIGMKGELWLARNQDDPSKTVGWIWEKHFARILPEEM